MNKFVKHSLVFVISLTALITSSAYAKNQDVAIVDMQQVEAKASVINDLVQKLQKEQSSLQTYVNNKSQDLQKRARELESKRGVLSASAIEEQRKSLENSLINLQNEAQMKNEAIQYARSEGIATIDKEMRDVVSKIAKKAKYKAVVAQNVLLFIDKSEFEDITDKVVADLNSSFKSVDISKYLKGDSSSSAQKKK